MSDLDDELKDELNGNGEVPIIPGRYPKVPDELNQEQKDMWKKIIRTKPWDWFDASNLPLLTNYVKTLWQLDRLYVAIEKLYDDLELDGSELKRLTGIQNQLSTRASDLATKMRLTQGALLELYKATKKAGPKVIDGETGEVSTGKPWEMGLPVTPGQRREFDNEN